MATWGLLGSPVIAPTASETMATGLSPARYCHRYRHRYRHRCRYLYRYRYTYRYRYCYHYPYRYRYRCPEGLLFDFVASRTSMMTDSRGGGLGERRLL